MVVGNKKKFAGYGVYVDLCVCALGLRRSDEWKYLCLPWVGYA